MGSPFYFRSAIDTGMAAKPYNCQVISFRMLTPTVFELCYEPDSEFEFEGGQFLSVVIPGAGPKGRDLRRAYSIASHSEKRPVELCVKLVEEGPGTNYLYRLRPGDSFKGVAPYGDFTLKTGPERNACLISTGTGIAPFRAMMMSESFKKKAPKRTLSLFGIREESEIVYEADFQALKILGVEAVTAISRPKMATLPSVNEPLNGSVRVKGRVTDYLKSSHFNLPLGETDFYLCGSSAMIDEVSAYLKEKGVDKSAIRQEVYYKVPTEGISL